MEPYEALIALARVRADTIALMVALQRRMGTCEHPGLVQVSGLRYGRIFNRIGSSSFVDMFDKRMGGRSGGHQYSEFCYGDISIPMPLVLTVSESDRAIFDSKVDYLKVNYLHPSLS